MNKHQARIKAQEAQNAAARKKSGRTAWAFSLFALLFLCGGPVFHTVQQGTAAHAQGDKPPQAVVEAPDKPSGDTPDAEPLLSETPWNLILVNETYPLPRDFTVALCDIPGGRVDVRIEKALDDMLRDAKKDGVSLAVCSSYRSVKKQRRLYEARTQSVAAASDAPQYGYLQPPGASEHHTGLAIDFLTAGSWELTEDFADTEAYRWLSAHAAHYGFVERYPKEKEVITRILWEPWHFRYVGTACAQSMRAFGLCLEEYCAERLAAYPDAVPKEEIASE